MRAEAVPVALPGAIRPDWPAPASVSALMSTREGGVSASPFDSLNLRPAALPGDVVDEPAAVAENQRRFAAALGAEPMWLDQVHGADVVRLAAGDLAPGRGFHRADASFTTEAGVGCVVLVADCLPVLLCDRGGRVVGAAHAGWRGLAAGVLERSVAAMCAAVGAEPGQLLAWLGPCIGPRQFEVGADVLAAFGADPAVPDPARFVPRPRPDGAPRWLAHLPQLARDRLRAAGVTEVSGGTWCTVADASRFFSFRRDRITGRLAAGIALRD
jgi:YfiH family protein